MSRRRIKLLIMLCGMVISISTALCHAQDRGPLPEVKEHPATVVPALLPKAISTQPIEPAKVKTGSEVSEKPWLWRFLEMITIGIAKYNTEKQSDGRPSP